MSTSMEPASKGELHSVPNGDLGHRTDAFQQPSVILKHAFLASLRDQNQVLFYLIMQDHLKELLGILYTPGEHPVWRDVRTVAEGSGAAEAVANYSNLFRRPVSTYLNGTKLRLPLILISRLVVSSYVF